jgi:LysM repeat protein
MGKLGTRRYILPMLGGALIGLSVLTFLFAPSRLVPAYAQGSCGDTVTVVAGDTLTRIAARCGTTVQAILAANPGITNPNLIFIGQVIEIPSGQEATATPTTAPSTPTPTPTPSGTTTTYVVQPGDNLTRIAQRLGTTVQAILAANPQITNPNLIFVGQVIQIPSGQGPTPTPTTVPSTPTPTPTPSGTTTTYVVQPGDNLTRIAQRFGTTVQAILAANPQITNPNLIFVGQVIQIPGGQVATPTPTATPSTTPTPQRISFAPGTTSATVSGNLPADGDVHYVIRAEAGQLLEVNVTAAHTVHLTIYGANGVVIFDQPDGIPFFRGTLPDTGDYQLVIEADTQATSYSMTVMIPQRISFAPGATSATEQGQLGARQQHAYILGAAAGQEMKVTVTASAGVVSLTIYGVDGTVLKNEMSEGTTFDGTLPITEDYIIAINAGDATASYTLVVEIT